MSARAYNPNLKNMVDNYRAEATKRGIATTHFNDEELYYIIDEWAGVSTAQEQMEAVMTALRENLEP